MNHLYSIKTHRHPVRVLAVIVLLMLAQALADSRRAQPPTSRMAPVSEAQKQGIARGLAGNFGLGPFQPSLEMKENVDFLLTPALLVQEAICDDIVLTYPTE